MVSALPGSGIVLQEGALAAAGLAFVLIYFAVIAITIASTWKIFTKAGQPGWAAIIPIYNVYILLKVVGRPAIWLVGFLIPLVNFIVSILVILDLAKSFGKGGGYAVGLIFLPVIFLPLLAFGDAQYQGPANGPQGGAAAAGGHQQGGPHQGGQRHQGGHQQGGHQQGGHQQGGHQQGGHQQGGHQQGGHQQGGHQQGGHQQGGHNQGGHQGNQTGGGHQGGGGYDGGGGGGGGE